MEQFGVKVVSQNVNKKNKLKNKKLLNGCIIKHISAQSGCMRL